MEVLEDRVPQGQIALAGYVRPRERVWTVRADQPETATAGRSTAPDETLQTDSRLGVRYLLLGKDTAHIDGGIDCTVPWCIQKCSVKAEESAMSKVVRLKSQERPFLLGQDSR